MSCSMPDPVHAARYHTIVLAASARKGVPTLGRSARVLVVDTARQRLGLLKDGRRGS